MLLTQGQLCRGEARTAAAYPSAELRVTRSPFLRHQFAGCPVQQVRSRPAHCSRLQPRTAVALFGGGKVTGLGGGDVFIAGM